MKTFNSRMSEKAKSCIWMSMMYSVTAIALCLVLVLLSEKNIDNLVAFIACSFLWHSHHAYAYTTRNIISQTGYSM